MKVKLRTRKTKKTKGHDHVALIDVKGDGKTAKHNRDHVHPIKNGIVLEQDEHTHQMPV